MAAKEDKLILYVKASTIDGKSLGECVFSHRFMMMISLKGIACTVIPVELKKLIDRPVGFTYKKVPVLVLTEDGNLTRECEDVKEIEELLFRIKPSLKWNREDPEQDVKSIAESEPSLPWHGPTPEENIKLMKRGYHLVEAMVNLGPGSLIFSKFNALLKNRDVSADEMLKHQLLVEMQRLNDFLKSEKSPGKFLFGDQLKYPDCVLLPKLLHIKVAGKHLKDFEIPEDLAAVHAYLAAASEEDAFSGTSPTEEVIRDGYENQLGLIPRTKSKVGKH